MQLVFPDDEAVQPHLKLLAMAKRWKKGQEEVPSATTETINDATEAPAPAPEAPTAEEDEVPLPEARVDDEEMNDES